MAWYDQISRMYDWRDRQVEKAREAGNAARLRRNPDAGPLRPLQLPSRRPRYDLNYQPWQREMVDPSHGGGKFGAPGIGGEGLLMASLPGAIGYRGALSRVLPRARITPSIPHARGGTVFRGQRFGRGATLNDLRANFARPHGAVRPTGTIQRDRILPRAVSRALRPRRGPHRIADQSLKGVRPYRGPRGIGLYKGTKTGPVNPPPPRGGGNPLRRWWRNNNPWM